MDHEEIQEYFCKAIQDALPKACYMGNNEDKRTPGICIAVTVDGTAVLQRGWGYADIGKAIPITPSTRFDLASLGKAFSAMGVLVCVNKGMIASVDEPICKYLPHFEPLPQIRIIDLLMHRSGLADYLDFEGMEYEDWYSNDQVVAAVVKHGRTGRAGRKLEYCNSNYVALGLLIETVSGTRLQQFLRDEIFVKLEMHNTYVLDVDARKQEEKRTGMETGEKEDDIQVVDPHRALGYDDADEGEGYVHVQQDVPITGDGSIISSVEDMLKWSAALDQPGFGLSIRQDLCPLLWKRDYPRNINDTNNKGSNKRANRKQRKKQRKKRSKEKEANDCILWSTGTWYTLGWYVTAARKVDPILWHSGGWTGVALYMLRTLPHRPSAELVHKPLCVIALSNYAQMDVEGLVDGFYYQYVKTRGSQHD